jgi:ATP-dependent RNA helicase DHX29
MADAIFKSLLAQAKAKALEARLNGVSLKDPIGKPEVPDVTQADDRDDKSDDSEDDLFGKMLDEPAAGTGGTDQADDPNSTIQIRSMPIPKSFAFSGNIPKAMLKAALAKNSKQASVSYIKLSGYSRAVRVGLEISWSSDRRKVWKMDELACEDLVEAENYVATLALSELSGRGEIGGVNWRVMPNEYRELWEELETKRSEQVEADKRDFWVKIRGIAGQQQSQSGLSAPQDKTGKAAPAVETAAPPSASVETRYSERLQADYLHRQATPAYQAMLPQRQSLPIASFRQQIIDTLETSQIVVLSGETGCGKSTQLPAYILEDQLSKGKACKVYVTEPRRISAISLAQRVSQELGERRGAVGSADSLVGYSIRMEAKISSNTRLAFVTNGIALRMLESGSAGRGTAFDQVTHIIVDEVHERSIDSDFLLIVLKQLVQQRPDLKVVLMSATLDADKISAFFGGCPTLSVPGRTFPVTVNHLEDAVELTGYHIDESSPYAVRSRFVKSSAKQLEFNENGADSDGSDSETEQNPAKLSSTKYSASTVSTVNLLDSRQIPYDLIVRVLETVCIERPEYQPFSAAILVFMPGLAEIRKLNELLQAHGHFGSADYVIFPLHSTISSEGQGQVFDIPPRGVRKIVICESSLK